MCVCCRDEAVSQDISKRTFVTGCITEWPADSPFPYAEVCTFENAEALTSRLCVLAE